MKSTGPLVAIAPFTLSMQEQELFSNALMVRYQDLPIVHFLKAEHFQSLLAERRILLRRADTYPDDTAEATYPETNRTESSHADAQIESTLPIRKDRDAQMTSQIVARSLSYIHCWYEGNPQTPHMWERYGNQGRGVCIRSTTLALQTAVGIPPDHLHCEIGRCTYWDESEALPEMVSSFPAFRKRKTYDDEQEIRLLARIKLEHTPADSEGHIVLPPQFQPLPVDALVLISTVTLGTSMNSDTRQEITELVAQQLGPERLLRGK